MTREEIENSKAYRVSKAALEYYNEHHQDNDINLIDAFEAGAEWDEEAMIEKACNWLRKTLYIHTEIEEDKDWGISNSINWVTSDHNSIEEFIENFKESLKS